MKKLYILGLMACTMAACKPNLEPEPQAAGDADFSRYLAVGNSLTAGFADNSLSKNGQLHSYPAMLSEGFMAVSGGKFTQPMLPGNDGWPMPKFVLAMRKRSCDTFSSITPILYPGALDSTGSSNNVAAAGPYNNTGIPGIRSIDFVTPGYGAVNPYARRFFATPATSRPIDEVIAVNPTFFTLWVGSNDVLGYALDGGKGGRPITDGYAFAAAYDTILAKLTSRGAKGVAMNIPDITAIPHFTTIPARGLTLKARQSNDLNNYYNTKFNGSGIRFVEGANYFVIEDETAPFKFRQIQEGEMVLLSTPADSLACGTWGTLKPIPAKYVLTKDEIGVIKAAVIEFNAIINTACAQRNIPLVDMNAYISSIQKGISYNGINYSTTFVSGGTFSLDGVHPTPRGYALIANQIIDRINEFYGAKLHRVDPNKYPGVALP
jgi:Phospholipase/lecithinase/hemolysin